MLLHGAGWENRTPNYSLENCRFTTKLIPRFYFGRTKRDGLYPASASFEYTSLMGFFNSLLAFALRALLVAGIWVTLALGGLTNQLTGKEVAYTPPIELAATSSRAAAPVVAPKTASTTPSKTVAPKKVATKAATPLPQTAAVAPTPAAPPVISNDTIQEANTETKASLVNIFCNSHVGNLSSYISGSGLIIDPRGVVLTNAHVAQFFLLQNYRYPGSTLCTIRTGSPAVAAYTAELLYISPEWVEANASQILSDHATGTGEHDFAFLLITGAAPSAPALPSSFPALSIGIETPTEQEPVLLAAYPAGFLEGNEIQGGLYSSSAVSSIQKLYTFTAPDHVDLVSLGGTVVSQSGSSGGEVINLESNKLVAMIATESEGTTTASRDLRAITMFHINQSLQQDGQGGIASLLSGDLNKAAVDFNAHTFPTLAAELAAALDATN